MRHLILALMILLLPLRGWMGDAMATNMAIDMATSVAPAVKTTAADAKKTSLNGHFEYPLLVQAAPAVAVQTLPDCAGHVSSDEAHGMQDEHCKPCQSCQACHTLALSSSLPDLRSVFAAPLMPLAMTAQFTSAVAALGQKPPIS